MALPRTMISTRKKNPNHTRTFAQLSNISPRIFFPSGGNQIKFCPILTLIHLPLFRMLLPAVSGLDLCPPPLANIAESEKKILHRGHKFVPAEKFVIHRSSSAGNVRQHTHDALFPPRNDLQPTSFRGGHRWCLMTPRESWDRPRRRIGTVRCCFHYS